MLLKTSFYVLTFFAFISYEAASAKSSGDHWDYSHPETWADTCSGGMTQSPIDITKAIYGSNLQPLDPHWNLITMKPFHNGHTMEVPYDAGSMISFRQKEFSLKQFHFHTPSEHTLEGKRFPLELHFVHKDESGKILVVGVFVEEGKFNPSLADVWDGRSIAASQLLPGGLHYYNYEGSLTTPPCSEGVTWIVLKEPIEASREQLGFISGFIKEPNSRPIQPLNGRNIETTEL